MENKELLEYLQTAIEVETDLATQEQILKQCCENIQDRKPILKLEDVPSIPMNMTDTSAAKFGAAGVVLFGVIMFLILVGAAWYLGFIFGAPFILIGFFIMKSLRNDDKIAAQQLEDHAKQRRLIVERNDQQQRIYNAAIRQCTDSTRALRAAVEPNIAATKELLEKLYAKGIIYRKYCTLPALTSIYEYFITGRCTELTGPHGAYNMYEDEVRKDTVISQLNTVIENLEQIKQNQYMLYQQVQSINENTQRIASELRQIKGYTVQIAQLTALNAYYAALNERNTRITMYYHL